jgi:hypothetical protein
MRLGALSGDGTVRSVRESCAPHLFDPSETTTLCSQSHGLREVFLAFNGHKPKLENSAMVIQLCP